MIAYRVEEIYYTGEPIDDKNFTNLTDARTYYETLIVDWEEDKEAIDYITIYVVEGDLELDELGMFNRTSNIETFTYDETTEEDY